MIIAIDGPSGAGKGLLSQNLAKKYHLKILDTGLLYRAAGYKMLEYGLNLEDSEAAARIAMSLDLGNIPERELRNEKVAQAASKISVYPEVRQALIDYQRKFAYDPPPGYQGTLLDGRDIGTKICPEADFKLFLIATPEIRAERRFKELQRQGIQSIYTSVLKDMIERDQRDQNREASPLKPATDAYVIDTSDLSPEEVLIKALNYIRERAKTAGIKIPHLP